MNTPETPPLVAIACGGTGGHLFPGLAVAEVLQEWGCEIALLVSKKEVDQEAVKSAMGMQVLPLPAVALQNWRWGKFLQGCFQSYRLCTKAFENMQPRAVLAMGGFTSAPPVLAGKRMGAATFLHESNSIPGRANRWLSPWVDEVFVGFPTAGRRLYHQTIRAVGTPVRPAFKPIDPGACRMSLGLQPAKPVLLVMGGSQGASGINRLIEGAIPILSDRASELQYLHITGPEDSQKLRASYAAHRRLAVVRPFLTEMELALGAATLVVNRAGASSLAELAAMRVPSILIPYPHATDNHQFYNAQAFVQSGAAKLLDQRQSSSEMLAEAILSLFHDPTAANAMRAALGQWHFPNAATDIAGHIFSRIGMDKPEARTGASEFTLPKSPLRASSTSAGGPERFVLTPDLAR